MPIRRAPPKSPLLDVRNLRYIVDAVPLNLVSLLGVAGVAVVNVDLLVALESRQNPVATVFEYRFGCAGLREPFPAVRRGGGLTLWNQQPPVSNARPKRASAKGPSTLTAPPTPIRRRRQPSKCRRPPKANPTETSRDREGREREWASGPADLSPFPEPNCRPDLPAAP